MSDNSRFLSGAKAHLKSFAKSNGVKEDDVYVRLTLNDGTHVIVRGLKSGGPRGAQGWGMIGALAEDTVDALVIREESIFSIEFQVAPMVRGPAGLRSEHF